jgi:hypothetical protein
MKKKTKKNQDPSVNQTENAIVGTTPALTEADIQACITHVQAIATVLAPYATTLTTAERRAQSRYRKEGDAVIPVLARLAKASGLESAAINVSAMQQKVALASVLQPLQTQVKTLHDTINDTVLSAHGGAWHTATTLHGALVRVAPSNPALRRDMEVVASAFTKRKKATAAKAAAAPTATSEATPAASAEAVAPHAPPVTATAPAATAPAAVVATGA